MKDNFLISNPFKMYRYEVIGAYVDFIFTDEPVQLRPNRFEDGYDDVTNIDKFEDFSDEIKLRFLPLIEQITEDEYIEIHDKIVYDDVKVTQQWGTNPSDKILLLKKFRDEKSLKKITEDGFLKHMVRDDYIRSDETELTLDDIDSFDICVTFYYEKSFDSVLVQLRSIRFNIDTEIRHANVKIDSGFYVPSTIIEYYFGIDRGNYKRRIVQELLQKEYLISPIMMFDADLYLSIKDKINDVRYEISRDK
jgi:hypothetical protein